MIEFILCIIAGYVIFALLLGVLQILWEIAKGILVLLGWLLKPVGHFLFKTLTALITFIRQSFGTPERPKASEQ